MPIYEYKCTKCGDTFEILQKFSDESLKICEKCSGELIKIISHAGFVLKGSGFYVNDHPSEERKKGLSAEKNGSMPLPSKSSKPSDDVKASS